MGVPVTVVTRAGRELGETGDVLTADGPSAIAAHRAVAGLAVDTIRERRPSVVVVQNYVIPPLELAVVRAAREAGARVVHVIHDHRLHTRRAGTRVGLKRLLRYADDIVVHSRFVGTAITRHTRRATTFVPQPVAVGMLGPEVDATLPSEWPLRAVHFGVLTKGYKGTEFIAGLARHGVPGWEFVVAGRGAPEHMDGVITMPGYVPTPALVATVRSSSAAVLPYRFATQSGAVALAQVLGCVPIASAVGGITEQIEHGVTGFLVPPDATTDAWIDALSALNDSYARTRMSGAAMRRRWDDHAAFVAGVTGLCAG
jgi:glycosyltransferase involved in cell wall biosynthesis